MNDYLVAAHDSRRTTVADQVPEGKCHAYLASASRSACGFGLSGMRLFRNLRFSDQRPAARCPICARIVGANNH